MHETSDDNREKSTMWHASNEPMQCTRLQKLKDEGVYDLAKSRASYNDVYNDVIVHKK